MRRERQGKRQSITGLMVIVLLAVCVAAGCSKRSKEGHITIVSELPDGEVNIPGYLVGSEAEEFALEKRESDDLSLPEDVVVFQVDGDTRAEVANRVASGIEKSLENILNDKEAYPNITDIDVNGEGDTFTVYLKGSEMNPYESSLQLGLIIAGNKYQIYKGVPMEEALTRVIFIDASTKQEILRVDSGQMTVNAGVPQTEPPVGKGPGIP